VTRFEPLPAADYETIHCVPVVVGCTGTFGQIHQFLKGLEQMPEQPWTASVRLDRTEESGKTIIAELRLEVFVDKSDNSDYAKRSV
jgi:hypothetical protein